MRRRVNAACKAGVGRELRRLCKQEAPLALLDEMIVEARPVNRRLRRLRRESR